MDFLTNRQLKVYNQWRQTLIFIGSALTSLTLLNLKKNVVYNSSYIVNFLIIGSSRALSAL